LRRFESLAIEGWSPEYGSPVDMEREEVPADQVDAAVELAEDEWRPVGATEGVRIPTRVYFVDGVRRVEARVWMTEEDESRLGICASYAAGVVRCGRKAEIVAAEVRRGFFGRAGVPDLVTRAGAFAACPVADDDLPQLINGLQERMGRLEVEVAGGWAESRSRAGSPRAGPGADSNGANPPIHPGILMVMDGPLRGRQRIPGAIGYVKSHRVQYLPAGPRAIVARLAPRQRTPIFLIQTKFTRYSWYLRLTEGTGHPWAGIVRCEAWPDAELERIGKIADATAVVLPRFASEPHKDDRAPQNLYPIAGLERELRRRLGDPGLMYRALQRAVAEYRPND
jgi:hypothetical protein